MAQPLEVKRRGSRKLEIAVALMVAVLLFYQARPIEDQTFPQEAFLIEREAVIAEAHRISDLAYFIEAIAPDSTQDLDTGSL